MFGKLRIVHEETDIATHDRTVVDSIEKFCKAQTTAMVMGVKWTTDLAVECVKVMHPSRDVCSEINDVTMTVDGRNDEPSYRLLT